MVPIIGANLVPFGLVLLPGIDQGGGLGIPEDIGAHQGDGAGELRPLGQLHNSFIVAAGRDGLWIVDQHVAHERILFEQVLKQQSSGHMEVQRLLMPQILQLTPEQQRCV